MPQPSPPVLQGRLTNQLRDGEAETPDTHGLLIEPLGTVNTGDAGGPLTAAERRAGA